MTDKSTGFNCHFCACCDGTGCVGQMPGMGGPDNSRNFLLNCEAWKKLRKENKLDEKMLTEKIQMPSVRLAPITGGVENVGYSDEKQFYFDLIDSVSKTGFDLCIGDGTPDCKLLYGIEAVKTLSENAAVFLKPYSNEKLFERIEWALPAAEAVGIDIDSYNIVTMRNLVKLEKKSAGQLKEIKTYLNSKGLPFAIKGIFTEADVELAEEVKPDIIYISNHGGRVETVKGSTGDFLFRHHEELLKNCDSLWVDGGLRTRLDFLTAAYFGASSVLMGRPFITALCSGNKVSF